jgi:ADP-dependent NAD(P)H-hydrate dehydratase
MPGKASRLQTVSALPQLPSRPQDSHKGMYGRVLVVGGSVAMPGSISLTANGAYRAGAGLVRILCPASAQRTAITLAPCATSALADETQTGHFALSARKQLIEQAAEHDVIAMGPGMGLSPACAQMVKTAVASIGKPLVLDATGLTCLAWLGSAPKAAGPLVITPHPGEAGRLLEAFGLRIGLTPEPESREAAARALAECLGCVVVLKGARTVVTDGRQLYVNSTGNPGLAKGGTGDVLTGVIAALIGQKFSAFDAAVLGTYLHGMAGDIGAERLGHYSLMATDLLDLLPEAFQRHSAQS